MKLMKKTFLAAALLAASAMIFAQDARSIVDKALNIKKPNFNHSIIEMDLINKAGKLKSTELLMSLAGTTRAQILLMLL